MKFGNLFSKKAFGSKSEDLQINPRDTSEIKTDKSELRPTDDDLEPTENLRQLAKASLEEKRAIAKEEIVTQSKVLKQGDGTSEVLPEE